MFGVPARLAATILLSACGADLVLPEGEGPATIRVVEGDGASGQTGQLVPLVVEVTDGAGKPLADVSVAFDLTSAGAGAGIAPQVATTDSTGKARTQMVLGSEAGVQTGEARVVMDGSRVPRTSFSVIVRSVDPDNQAPTADYNFHCENLTCQFTDASSDDDGSVTGWDWRFGDGQSSNEREPSHSYAWPGSYTVTLTVTDNGGSTDATESEVTVSEPSPSPNQAPHAEFEVHCGSRTCVFVDKSTDDDGSVVEWLWDFGDGSATTTERNPSHTYQGGGHYQFMLTVTDDRDAIDVKTHKADLKH
jgi:PKD repeat protein